MRNIGLEGQTGETKAGYQTPNFKEIHVAIKIKPPTIKIFCRVCDEIMPYNFIGGSDISDDFRNYKNQVSSQIFIMKYQCQGCNSTPEVFMIQRDGPKIILTGRTPMEKVITPNYIPKSVKKYYSDAIVAFNSGQTLAGNFLLRTFVEQYIRSKSENSDSQDVDKLLIDYKRILPDDFKQRFPSLESIYATLSNDIHTAGASEKVFNQAIEDINLHFDAKRIYKIHSS